MTTTLIFAAAYTALIGAVLWFGRRLKDWRDADAVAAMRASNAELLAYLRAEHAATVERLAQRRVERFGAEDVDEWDRELETR